MQIGFNAPTTGALIEPDSLRRVITEGEALGFDYVTVQAQVAPPVLTVPVIHIPAPDLTVYDALRAGAAA